MSEKDPPTEIETLARNMVDEREIKLASRLALLMNKPGWCAAHLIHGILPVYHENRITLEPRMTYRIFTMYMSIRRGAVKNSLTVHL